MLVDRPKGDRIGVRRPPESKLGVDAPPIALLPALCKTEERGGISTTSLQLCILDKNTRKNTSEVTIRQTFKSI